MVTTPDSSRRPPGSRASSTVPDTPRPSTPAAGPVDGAEPVATSVFARMGRQRRRDTAPETALRRALHSRGFRFQVDHPVAGLPRRRADIVFTRVRLAVFVDGCFWHACPEHGTTPRTRNAWWTEKLDRNVARDRDTDARLRGAGWTVLRFWEHQSAEECADIVAGTYRALSESG